MSRRPPWNHQARSRPSALTVSPPVSRWIYHPAVDLIVGCGARSAQAKVESAHPGATSAARQAQAALIADALARYPPGLAP
jgi:hypothetical protein